MENSKIKKQEQDVEIDDRKKKQKIPFIQVDKGGDIFSNFLSNFLRQFKNQEGNSLLGLLGSLLRLGPKLQPMPQQLAKPSDIMGATQDDAKLAREKREHWQEKLKDLPSERQSKKQSLTSPLRNEVKQENTASGNATKKPGLRL